MLQTCLYTALSSVVILLITGVCRADDRGTIVVERPFETPFGYTHYIYVNDEKIGTVSGDEKKSFKFTPAKDGKNNLEVIEYDIIGVKQYKKTETFKAWAGAEIYCYSPCKKLRVTVKDQGTKPIKSELKTITLDRKPTTKEVKSKIIETPAGIEREYEISQTIERSVSFSKNFTTEYGKKMDLAIISGEIRKKIETDEKVTFKQSETIRQNLKIDGSKTPRVEVVWVESERTGKATLIIDGEEKQIPFSLPVELDAKITVLKE